MGNYFNTGEGVYLQPVDIGHKYYTGLISADTAFWLLVKKSRLSLALNSSSFLQAYCRKEKLFLKEMDTLRFGLKPSAIYFNPTDRCNMNCSYCYIPGRLRKNGRHMSTEKLFKALGILKDYFSRESGIPTSSGKSSLPKGHKPEGSGLASDSQSQKPQIVFHGAEPMLNKEAVFLAIEKFERYFRFGIQTNATLFDAEAIKFLTSRGISIGLSLDGHNAKVADCLRRNWSGQGVFQKVKKTMEHLRGYENYSVICTVTKENMSSLVKLVEFLHKMEVGVCMLNPLRCTLSASRKHKPLDSEVAGYYLKALDRTYQLYKKTKRKLVVANFANVLAAIIAPTARRLMCDISPCGAGRCFFAIKASGDLFPCSEFIGLKKFKGGNIFKDDISKVLETKPFKSVTERRIENIKPCSSCAIRHFCGAPCPAEAWAMNGSIETKGAFCELYEEQVRYAFRLIADDKVEAYLWDGWDKNMVTTFKLTGL